jgi:hypothetical protein
MGRPATVGLSISNDEATNLNFTDNLSVLTDLLDKIANI